MVSTGYGEKRAARALLGLAERGLALSRRIAFWTGVLVGVALPVVLVFRPALWQVTVLVALATGGLALGRPHGRD